MIGKNMMKKIKEKKSKRKKLKRKKVTLDQKNNQIIENNQKRGKL
tara:strand:- start:438 stop:572 length:135 start_codon:yes stop_codon:yes gene_type:complete